MSLVIIAFIMIAGLGIAAILKLECESRSEQIQRVENRRDARFVA